MTLSRRSATGLLQRVLDRLRNAYGPRPWKCWGKGVDVLVGTILSQNTSRANSTAGYRQLRRELRTWKAVADAPVDQVERWIRVSGLSRLKAPRVQQIFGEVAADDRYEIHVLLIEHGRRICRAVNPKCGECAILSLCPFGKVRVRATRTALGV